MRSLNLLDYAIIAVYTVICFAIGLYFTKKASKSTEDYFLGGRSMPWWLLGTSMAATNLSTDTPLAITKYVFEEGIAGCWFFWAAIISVPLTVFFFAQLWRRAEIMTDVEMVEKRYGGKAGAALRMFKGFYFGVLINSVMMGWVYKGLLKMLTGVTNLNSTEILVIFTAIVIIYTFAAGFLAVVWTDLVQYFLSLCGFIFLCFYAVRAAGGLSVMVEKIHTLYPDGGVTQFYPHWPQAAQWMPFSVFMTYLLIQWWANKFADGAGKHIQRMSSAKNEYHAVLGTFFFAFMNYVLQVWPWILTALAALVIFGRNIPDPEMAFPMLIAKFIPHGILGLLVVSVIANFMDTIATHINLGSSYLINDIYRRFLVRKASEKHYVLASRLGTLVVLGFSIIVAINIQSIGNTWKVLIEFASGAGLVWVLRWFWWRINAWSEFTAMIVSGIVTIIIEITNHKMLYSYKMWTIISITTVAWVVVTFLTKPVDENVLRAFAQKVGPVRIGWKWIYDKYKLRPTFEFKTALFSWFLAVVFLFSLNFGLGSVLLQNPAGWILLAISAVVFVVLLFRIKKQTAPRITE